VWRWGGDYAGNKDAMHFEIVCSPADLEAGVDPVTVPGGVSQEEGDMPDIIKAKGGTDVFITRGYVTKRRITLEHAGLLVYFGKAEWNKETNGPYEWPADLVDGITSVDDAVWNLGVGISELPGKITAGGEGASAVEIADEFARRLGA
jgi:hypothetical protein